MTETPWAPPEVRASTRALIERGNITLREWKDMHANTVEVLLVYPALDNEALVYVTRQCLKNIPVMGPCSTYADALARVLAPELARRLEAKS